MVFEDSTTTGEILLKKKYEVNNGNKINTTIIDLLVVRIVTNVPGCSMVSMEHMVERKFAILRILHDNAIILG